MTEEIEVMEELEEASDSFVSRLRRVLTAGVGAVALAQDEIEEFVEKLVERGEIAERDGRELIEDIKKRRREKAKQAEESLEKRLEQILARLNVPTKSEIEQLNEKITLLVQKVDELKAKQS